MKQIITIILGCIHLMVPVLAQQDTRLEDNIAPLVRFATLDIYIDSGDKSLAAFQFELKAGPGQIKIVGVEGGQHEAFNQPPYYDTKALMQERIIIAAFNTSTNLPKGRTRIATVHLQITGDSEPEYELKLVVSADGDGEKIPAKISFEKGEKK